MSPSLVHSLFAVFVMAAVFLCLLDVIQAATAADDLLLLTRNRLDSISLGLPARQEREVVHRLLRNGNFRSIYAANVAQLEAEDALISNLRRSNQAKLERIEMLRRNRRRIDKS